MKMLDKVLDNFDLPKTNYKIDSFEFLGDNGELKIIQLYNGEGSNDIEHFIKGDSKLMSENLIKLFSDAYWAWVVISYFINGGAHTIKVPIVRDNIVTKEFQKFD